jgi:hypothetical protein
MDFFRPSSLNRLEKYTREMEEVEAAEIPPLVESPQSSEPIISSEPRPPFTPTSVGEITRVSKHAPAPEPILTSTKGPTFPQKLDERILVNEKLINQNIRGRSLLFEELIFSKISKELQINFIRNVSPVNNRDTFFDGVAITPDKNYVLEIKISQSGTVKQPQIDQIFQRIENFYSILDDDLKRKFVFILAFASEGDKSKIDSMGEKIRKISETYSFMSIIKVMISLKNNHIKNNLSLVPLVSTWSESSCILKNLLPSKNFLRSS